MRIILSLLLALGDAPINAMPEAAAVIYVDVDASPGGNGTRQRPFNNIADAVDSSRMNTARRTIDVAPGTYVLEAPLELDHPVALQGSSRLVTDHAGLPTSEIEAGSATRIVAGASLGAAPLIRVGRADSVAVKNIDIHGFVLTEHNHPDGIAVKVTRVQGLTILDNVISRIGLAAIETLASSGRIAGNHISAVGAGSLIGAGYQGSRADVTFERNRSVRNRLGGVLLNGSTTGIADFGDQLDVVVKGNDLSDNVAAPGAVRATFGVRLFVIRKDPGAPGDGQAVGGIHAVLKDNRIVGNEVGISIDAGFPYRTFAGACDARTYSGAIDVDLKNNVVADSRLTPGIISLTRQHATIDPRMQSRWQFLHGATFSIRDHDGSLADAWVDHPERDPVLGSCANDRMMESLGNTLTYNGDLLAPGTLAVPRR